MVALLVRVACPLGAHCPLATGNGQRVRVACPSPVDARCVPVGCALPVGNGQRARSERCLPVDRVSPVGRALPVGPRFHGQLTLQRATLRVHFAVSLVSVRGRKLSIKVTRTVKQRVKGW